VTENGLTPKLVLIEKQAKLVQPRSQLALARRSNRRDSSSPRRRLPPLPLHAEAASSSPPRHQPHPAASLSRSLPYRAAFPQRRIRRATPVD
jgi:hypothetical protein